ncbi:recombinase family protein [Corynebacterium freneyi]|uniref:recombinase family protein n=1 Tax=Corynebacterium freneyi TaxID=134034 RepID=UPI00254ADCB7|nr:recombinase family protein [Corynebacterium freneyi]MDK8768945.1 recombinase family protein [Corynebacterium freneyi]
MNKPVRAVIYCRISLDRHDEAGVERQEEACRRLAAAHDAEIVDVFIDNSISAYSGRTRPAYDRMMATIAGGRVDRVYTFATDRIARRTKEILAYLEACTPHRVTTYTVTGENLDPASPNAVFLTTILGAVAQQESTMKATRIRAARRQAAERGLPRVNRRSFGFTTDMGHVETEADAIRDGIDAVIAGQSLSAIARKWNSRGLTTVRGAEHTRGSVREILTKPSIAGLSSYIPTRPNGHKYRADREIVAEGQWDPIVDRATWEKAMTILANPSRRHAGAGGTEIHSPLAGLVICTCGDTMYRRTRKSQRKGAPRRAFYSCRRSTPGRQHVTIGDEVEALIAETVLSRLERPDSADALAAALAPGDAAATLITERRLLLQRRDDLEEEAVAGRLAASVFSRLSTRIEADLAALDDRIAAQATGPSPAVVDAARAPDIRAWWADATAVERRDVTAALITRVEISPGRPGAKVFDPGRVTVVWRTD